MGFLISVLISVNFVFSWDQHILITQAALSKVPGLNEKLVTVTEFSDVLTALGFSSHLQFNESLKIHKKFEFKTNEVVGSQASVLEILARYSDEPDWGMDKELFSEDQYPELWKPEYAMMGGKTGTPSQAFRHMYYPKYSLAHPLNTFRLPLEKLKEAMGEAPTRAQIFLQLSKKAKELGFEYWGVRFLANALHYIEDVTSPFHTSQTPTKKFIFLVLTSEYASGFKNFVREMTSVVAYYHFSFERYIGHLMNAEPAELVLSLTDPAATGPGFQYTGFKLEKFTEKMAKYSNKFSSKAGRASLEFFPEINVPYLTFDPNQFQDQAWWNEVIATGQQNTPERNDYYEVVLEMFQSLGWSIRKIVETEL